MVKYWCICLSGVKRFDVKMPQRTIINAKCEWHLFALRAVCDFLHSLTGEESFLQTRVGLKVLLQLPPTHPPLSSPKKSVKTRSSSRKEGGDEVRRGLLSSLAIFSFCPPSVSLLFFIILLCPLSPLLSFSTFFANRRGREP